MTNSLIALIAASALAACGSDTEDPAPDAGGGSGGPVLNGCRDSDFVRRTGDAEVPFGPGLAYDPKCLIVSVGAKVTFTGSFTAHPLSPGAGPSNLAAGSPNNPIQRVTGGSDPQTFTFSAAGTYPYFCEAHFPTMVGVVRVE